MHADLTARVCLLTLVTIAIGINSAAAEDNSAPETIKETVEETIHGVKIADPYRWLEDQHSAATREWIDRQNRHTDEILAKFPGRERIARRLGELMKVDSISTPTPRGGRYFFTRQDASRDLPVLCLRDGNKADDEILIDPQKLSADGSKTVSLLDASQDGKLLAYGIRVGGEDEVEVRLFDVDKRADTADRLERARYFGVSLSFDKRTVFYSRHGKEGSRVYRRGLGAAAEKETLIFGEGYDAGVGISPGLSEDGRYLLINVWYGSAARKTEIYARDLAGDRPIAPIVKDIEARFAGGAVDNRLFVRTNWNAPNGKIVEIDLERPDPKAWKEIVPEQKTAVLHDFSLVGGSLYANYLENVASSVRVFSLSGEHVRDISFPTLGTVSGVSGEWTGSEAFFAFNSFHVPTTIYREDVATHKSDIWARTNVPVKSDKFEVVQVRFPSKDNTSIPMFLVHKKGLPLDGNNPTLLSGYGGFNVSLTPAYSTRAVLWIEQGGVYAVANLRGGGEFGEKWHEAGMLGNKQNVFDDFLAAARWLIDNRYTRPEKLAITGRSNGGLLVGAALTQAPELFQAVVCGYPLLDMIRYDKFLVAKFWVPEYGSADDSQQFKTLLAYSPYHHVTSGTKYPAVLFLTGDADTRVDPLHARKMTALLQAATASDRPILLKYDTKLGHTGARPVSQSIDDLTDEFSFLFQQLNVSVSDGPAETAAMLNDLFEREWEWKLQEDPIFASELGDRRYADRWPDATLGDFERRHNHRLDVLQRLEAIDAGALSPDDRLNYQLFRKHYENDAAEYPFQWHLIPVNHRDGIQDAGALADSLRFESAKDYQDWLARMRAFPRYVEQTIALMRAGVKQQMLLPKIVMERVPAQIRRQIVDDPERSQFFRPFLDVSSEVPAGERGRLAAQAKKTIAEQIVPAYRKFAAFFENEFLPACPEKVGVWQLPRGKELYEFRARQFTTTDLAPQQIHEIGLREVTRIRSEMEKIVQQVGFKGSFRQFLEHLRTDPQFYFKDTGELLAAYLVLCKKIDPQLPKLFRKLPRIPYGVEAIPEQMAADTTTAYYRPPSADGLRAGTYFVNLYRPEVRPKYEMEALSLHEAVPGHHLQIALASELVGLPAFRRFASFTAYVEGWGLYAEGLGTELGLYRDPYSKFGQLTYEMWRAVRLVVDTGMHFLHWTREDAINFFTENTAKTEHDIANEVDRYISWPGQALAYKIGELKIRELRDRAQKAWGGNFDIREFHDVVLRQGAVPLDVLEEIVAAWIENRR